ncbi:hypothetical protein GUITHDRAFT_105189 [Guillardia theta CCMP2712]|uniref:Uncharacterized protein n=1 Tax=Guillardia theta (strain CCMP2712) TaxID=905079 RepID=L1JL93_GUITC|nr:hypothetical protein GUITHDRAFT_105189 [Guillardia theta CCMP2712]EKX49107.1 hypothetical protein GUITHDRAFT_105189 [Guillardia theta CCMP2712]|eukprot:XP_005836087.1 hypothetical protein GUITHDRAFT_105189 [Guillardia theta CCMP2712]
MLHDGRRPSQVTGAEDEGARLLRGEATGRAGMGTREESGMSPRRDQKQDSKREEGRLDGAVLAARQIRLSMSGLMLVAGTVARTAAALSKRASKSTTSGRLQALAGRGDHTEEQQ